MTQMRKSVSESLSPCPVWCLKIWYFNKVCGEEKTPQSQVQDHSALYPSRPLRNLTETLKNQKSPLFFLFFSG